ncbi:MAG: SusC/RagA family TonB-linked outer membrane protein [Bacteroidales bacterium]|jgi:TonB-linked SusC/RagA family outer membrane protein|nr:SusC/RagA family TonB-linked outer membrane protein [Bacteroidales bacterium]
MKKTLVLLGLMLLMTVQLLGQARQVTGTVTDALDGTTLIGVTVLIKGTTTGATTDINGRYQINASPADVLIFRFVGMESVEEQVGERSVINVALVPSATTLQQVVVTALGIEREVRTLTYNVQNMNSEDILSSRQENLVNALQGRVSGVQITSTGGAPGAASEIILRGATSVDGENQPLFVIDGIPISNASVRGTTNRAADINPSDIESMSILKGAAAAALYGIDAANGAIIITTKRGKEGAISVGLSTSTTLSQVGLLHQVQNNYSTGSAGLFNPRTFSHWGPPLLRSDHAYDNLGNFFETGMANKVDANVSGGTSNMTYYLALSSLGDDGIVPNTFYGRNSAMLTGTLKISPKISLTTSSSIMKTNNQTGIFSASGGWLMNVYRWPRWDNMVDYLNTDGSERNVWIPLSGNLAEAPDNPMWSAYHQVRKDNVSRNINSFNLTYQPLEWLTVNYTTGRDYFQQHYKAVSEPGSAGSAAYEGAISEFDRESEKITSTLVVTADYDFTDKLRVTALAGHNLQSDFARNTFVEGERFRNPTLHSINNLREIRNSQSTANRRIIGVFGDLTIDYGRFLVLGVTGRNDWSSTLPFANRSFFYPSYSAAFIFSELLDGQMARVFSFAKLRASFAQVGKDAPPHRLTQTLEQFYGIGGGWKNGAFAGNPILRPEITKEIEIGTDLRLWNGLFTIDFTYYQRESNDQIIQPRVTPVTGAILQTVNSGSVENKGIELLFGTRILKTEDIHWEITLNGFGNRSKLTKLFGDLVEFPVTYGQVSSQAIASSWLGEALFGIVGTDYERNDEGQVIVNEDGYPFIDSEKRYIGNREPKLYYGFSNDFRYGNLEFSFLVDGAYGAQLLNATSQFLISSGNHVMMEEYRNQEFVFEGVVEMPDGSYAANTKPIVMNQTFFNNYYILAGTNFVEEVAWVRLRNVSLTYYIPRQWLSRIRIQDASLNVNFQNLLLLTNYSGGDPEVNNAGPGGGASGAGTMGVDYFQVPPRKAVTFGLNLKF